MAALEHLIPAPILASYYTYLGCRRKNSRISYFCYLFSGTVDIGIVECLLGMQNSKMTLFLLFCMDLFCSFRPLLFYSFNLTRGLLHVAVGTSNIEAKYVSGQYFILISIFRPLIFYQLKTQ